MCEGPARLEDDNEEAVVEEADSLRAVLTPEALVVDQGHAHRVHQHAQQVPRLAAAEPGAQPNVGRLVRLQADEGRGDGIGHLAHQDERPRQGAAELKLKEEQRV